MFSSSLPFALLSLSYLAVSAPIASQPSQITKYERPLGKRSGLNINPINKRAEAGPEMGGANFPDPSISFLNNVWYGFATSGNGKNIQMASSPDFNTWTLSGDDAMPDISPATWIDQSSPNVWAPDVVQVVSLIYRSTHLPEAGPNNNRMTALL